MYPYEAVMVAALNFGSKLIELEIENLKEMDPDLKRRMQLVRVQGLERVERILSGLEALPGK